MRPTPALRRASGSPVTFCSVTIGIADGTERHRRGVRQQADAAGVERREAQAGQHGGRHRDRRSESRRAFDERAEGERDQQRLQTAVAGQIADGILDDFEFARVNRDVVEQNGREHHPADGEQSLRGAVGDGAEHDGRRHPVDEQRHQMAATRPASDDIQAAFRTTPSMNSRTKIGSAATSADKGRLLATECSCVAT